MTQFKTFLSGQTTVKWAIKQNMYPGAVYRHKQKLLHPATSSILMCSFNRDVCKLQIRIGGGTLCLGDPGNMLKILSPALYTGWLPSTENRETHLFLMCFSSASYLPTCERHLDYFENICETVKLISLCEHAWIPPHPLIIHAVTHAKGDKTYRGI